MKNRKLINFQLNDQGFRTCGKVHVQMASYFFASIVQPIADLKGLRFNALNTIF